MKNADKKIKKPLIASSNPEKDYNDYVNTQEDLDFSKLFVCVQNNSPELGFMADELKMTVPELVEYVEGEAKTRQNKYKEFMAVLK